MAYRSWLKDVTKVEELANFLHSIKWSEATDDRIDRKEAKGYGLSLNRDLPVDEKSNKYFGSGLHDTAVASVKHDGDRVEIQIDNIWIEDFASYFYEKHSLQPNPVSTSVWLKFEGVNYVNAARYDLEGWLKWSDWKTWRSTKNYRISDTLRRDWFTQQEGNIQWICGFHKYDPNASKLSGELFLMIDCDRAYAVEESDKNLRAKMGEPCFEAWLQFKIYMEVNKKFFWDFREFLDQA